MCSRIIKKDPERAVIKAAGLSVVTAPAVDMSYVFRRPNREFYSRYYILRFYSVFLLV